MWALSLHTPDRLNAMSTSRCSLSYECVVAIGRTRLIHLMSLASGTCSVNEAPRFTTPGACSMQGRGPRNRYGGGEISMRFSSLRRGGVGTGVSTGAAGGRDAMGGGRLG